jgi:nucleotide-binding universal stress UspA family protein
VLHEAAVRLDASMIVVGSTTRGRVGRVAPGATAARLLHAAPCPLAVATTALDADWQPERIGAAFIDLDDGREALRVAAALADAAGATLLAATAIEPIQWSRSAVVAPYRTDGRIGSSKTAAKRALDDAIEHLPLNVRATSDVLVGRASDALTALSGDVDLLVCGSRGYGRVRSALLGGVSRRVIRDARCPVIVVPAGGEAKLEERAEIGTTAAR